MVGGEVGLVGGYHMHISAMSKSFAVGGLGGWGGGVGGWLGSIGKWGWWMGPCSLHPASSLNIPLSLVPFPDSPESLL